MKKPIICLLIVFCFGYVIQQIIVNGSLINAALSAPVEEKVALTNDGLWNLINEWRENNNLTRYENSEFLCNVAEIRLVEIQKDFSHDKFAARRFCQDCTIGENLGENISSDALAVSAWIQSPGHRENLERPFTHSCIRTLNGYAVQIFGYY